MNAEAGYVTVTSSAGAVYYPVMRGCLLPHSKSAEWVSEVLDLGHLFV